MRFSCFPGRPNLSFFSVLFFFCAFGSFTLYSQLSDSGSGSGSARQRMRLLGCLLCGNEVWVLVRRRKGEVVRE